MGLQPTWRNDNGLRLSAPRRRLIAVLALASRLRRIGEHRRHHRPVRCLRRRTDRGQRLAGRDLRRKTTPGLLGRHARSVLRKSRRPPQVGFTQFIVKQHRSRSARKPVGELKTVRVDLPVGLSVNPQATATVPAGDLRSQRLRLRRLDSQVGESAGHRRPLLGIRSPPIPGVTQVAVYNIDPPNGQPARFGLEPRRQRQSSSRPTSPGTATTTRDSRSTSPEPAARSEGSILKNRLVFNGRSGDGTFITTPSTCCDPEQPPHEHAYSTYLLASSIAEEANPGYSSRPSAEPAIESPLPKGKKPIDCAGVPYEPSARLRPGHRRDRLAGRRDRPKSRCPHIIGGDETRELEHQGSPGRAAGRASASTPRPPTGSSPAPTRSSARAAKHPVACPPESKVGTVAIETPPLPDGLAQRRRLRRHPAQPRPGLRRRVPDLRRRRVRAATASRCGCSAGSAPTRPPDS